MHPFFEPHLLLVGLTKYAFKVTLFDSFFETVFENANNT